MRKAVFFAMTVKYVLRLVPQSKVYYIRFKLFLCCGCTLISQTLQAVLVWDTWRTSKDPSLKRGRCLLTTHDLVSIILNPHYCLVL